MSKSGKVGGRFNPLVGRSTNWTTSESTLTLVDKVHLLLFDWVSSITTGLQCVDPPCVDRGPGLVGKGGVPVSRTRGRATPGPVGGSTGVETG